MKHSTSSIALAVGLLFSCVTFSHELQCYSCVEELIGNATGLLQQSLPQWKLPAQKCNTPYEDAALVPCNAVGAACYKYSVVVHGSNIGRTTAMVNTCEPTTVQNCARIQGKSVSVELECSTCNEDKCNSATSSTASLLLIVSPALLYKLLH